MPIHTWTNSSMQHSTHLSTFQPLYPSASHFKSFSEHSDISRLIYFSYQQAVSKLPYIRGPCIISTRYSTVHEFFELADTMWHVLSFLIRFLFPRGLSRSASKLEIFLVLLFCTILFLLFVNMGVQMTKDTERDKILLYALLQNAANHITCNAWMHSPSEDTFPSSYMN